MVEAGLPVVKMPEPEPEAPVDEEATPAPEGEEKE